MFSGLEATLEAILESFMAGGDWFYPLLFTFVSLDALIPPLPSEVLAMGTGSMVAQGLLNPVAAVAVSAGACFTGDVALYLLFKHGGRYLSRFGWGRWLHRTMTRLMLKLGTGGTYASLLGMRFLPGGRSASMAAAGISRISWRVFAPLAATGAVLWAIWMMALGNFTANVTGFPIWASTLVGMIFGTLVGILLAGALAIYRRRRG
jgi:membrane protein DedA with SNARE-associated domain